MIRNVDIGSTQPLTELIAAVDRRLRNLHIGSKDVALKYEDLLTLSCAKRWRDHGKGIRIWVNGVPLSEEDLKK